MMTEAVGFHFYQARTRPSIGLTPLIDVVFILLLFFMLASNFNVETSLSMQSGGNAATSTQSAPGTASTLTTSSLRIVNAESVELNGVALDNAALKEALAKLYASDANHALSISVAEGIRVQALLDLIALAENIGLTRVTMESLLP